MNAGDLSPTLAKYGVTTTVDQTRLLERYCELLWHWNLKINLTRHTDFETFVARDVVDTVELAGQLAPGESVLDVGSGGGAPGLLLAILRPDLSVTLSESIRKKAAVLSDMVARLELPCDVQAIRAEKVLAERSYDTVVARAVGSIAKVLRWFRPHWSSMGRLLLIKGPRWLEERVEARHLGLLKPLELRRLHGYRLPGTESEGVILMITSKTQG